MCIYKIYLISVEGYKNANVEFLTIKTTSEIWFSMKDVGSSMGVKSISDLVLKEIYGICETKNPTKEQVYEYKMPKREIYKKFANLIEKELNTKNNKKAYVRNDVMTTIIKFCRGEKTRGIRSIDEFRNKLMIPDFEIPKCPEIEGKSKIGKIFKNQNPFDQYSVKIYKIDPYFYYKNGCKYILSRIDIYFSECFLAVEIDEKRHADRDLIFEKKRQKALENNLVVNLLELIQVMQKMIMI